MTKADIVSEISKKTGIDKSTVLTTVEAFMGVVKDSLAGGNNVYLRGFGSFILKESSQNSSQHHKEYYYHHSGTLYSCVQARKEFR